MLHRLPHGEIINHTVIMIEPIVTFECKATDRQQSIEQLDRWEILFEYFNCFHTCGAGVPNVTAKVIIKVYLYFIF